MPLLSVRREGVGPAFVWLHGFTQTGRSASRFRSILAESRELWSPDLPGHGESLARATSLEDCADVVATLLDGPTDLGGYSLGGRVALHVALRHPSLVSRLVLLSATRGIEDVDERAARRARDEALADHLEAVGVDVFLDEWLAQPLFADVPPDALERASRSSRASGLAASLRCCGTGTQSWLGDQLASIAAPTIALAGERDVKFVREAVAIGAGVKAGTVRVIADAGHAAHLVQPRTVARLINDFLN